MNQLKINQFYEWIKSFAKKDSLNFDFHGFQQEKTHILFQKKKLKNCSCSEIKHLNLRVLNGDRAGTSYTKDFSKKSLEDCYKRAVDSLHFSDKKERGELSKKEIYRDPSPFYDESLKDISLESKIQKAKQIAGACLDMDKRVQPVYSSATDWDIYSFFANSEGSQSFHRSNNVRASCYALAIQEDHRANSYSECNARNYKTIDFKKIGKEAATKALSKLNSSVPETKKYPVVFQSGPAVGELVLFLTDLMNGKSVFEGLSPLKDSLNKPLFSEQVSLYDDPFSLWGLYSETFDGEGFATEKTLLVEKGILKNYLTSSFFSKALKAPHTKKACWVNDKGALSVSSTNLFMPEGESSFDELMERFPQLIVIDDLHGRAGYNFVSGDFSKEAEGFLWDKGERRPLSRFTVSGNIKDLFSSVLKTGKDTAVYAGKVKAPSFLVPDLMIAGK